MVYHGIQAAGYFLLSNLSSDKATHEEKSSHHISACKQDLRSFLQIHRLLSPIPFYIISKTLFCYSFPATATLLFRIGVLTFACSTGLAALFGILIGLSLIALVEPKDNTEDFVSSYEEAIALAKSIYLRRDFGIVSENGQLLTHSKKTDLEDSEFTGQFGKMLCIQALEVLKAVQHLQENLPEEMQLQPESQINKKAILAHLRKQTLPEAAAGFDYEEWIKNFEQLYLGVEKLARCLDHCVYIKHNKTKDTPIKITPIPYPEDYIRQFFIPNVTPVFHELFDWEEFLDTKVICVLRPTDGNCSAVYSAST